MKPQISSRLWRFFTFALLTVVVAAQQTSPAGGGPTGTAREAMWPAPTAEDWRSPCLIQWQRSWDDALAISKQTGRPILVCVNMDGEIASEHYAGIRYRRPDTAKLYEPYVTVIASVYRHTPRDYDENGQRIPCPRFGCVTCGEHIAIEPILYEKFMDGRRIAPRHIMVELDGAETYDVFYAFDTDSVFKAIREGITLRNKPTQELARGDRTLEQRVASKDSNDRTATEQAYANGSPEQRKALLEAALANGQDAPIDLLRLALFGFDAELNQVARKALAQTNSESAVDLINQALRVPLAKQEREPLVAALERLGANSPRARTLAAMHQGLDGRNTSLKVEDWAKALTGGATYTANPDLDLIEARLDDSSKAARARPKDTQSRLEMAQASLALALDPRTAASLTSNASTASKHTRLLLEDARRSALAAEQLGASGWQVHATIAVAAHYMGDRDQALARAEQAMVDLPSDASSFQACAVLGLFAQARQLAITKAWQENRDWPSQWLTDLSAAHALLLKHPLGSDQQAVDHYDFLSFLGGAGSAAKVLETGLARFPDSALLHDRLRDQILRDKGVGGLAPHYEALLAAPNPDRTLAWFAGYAALVAGEFHRRGSHSESAQQAYDRAIAYFERSMVDNPDSRATCDHYIAMAHGGLARVAFEDKAYDRALAQLITAFDRCENAAATLDGLNVSAVDTAKMLRARLKEDGQTEAGARLQAALDRLDPKMLELPAFERETPPAGNATGRRRRGQ